MRPVFVCLVVLTCAFAALGQGTTGAIIGTVTTDGSPLPGVTVTVSSPALQGVRTTITGENGAYTFPALPPGSYSVLFELSGMSKVTKRVQLALATTTRADAEMAMSSVSEAITVTASAPSVLETTQVAANYTREQIDNLPVTRDIRNTVLLAPGVNSNGPGNNVMISGAPAYDSVYVVNGVVVNENLRGQPHSLFIEDAIQETTVMTGGISAEYGRFTGGVVSTITKSGGNTFTGSFRDTFSNPSWTDETPFRDASGNPQAENPDKLQQVYEATLGGFLLRDRLWFFGGGRKASKTPVGTAMSTQRFTSVTNIAYENYQDETRYEAKLTGAITPNHNIVASYIDVALDETNNAFGAIGDVDSIVPTRSLPNTLAAASYSGVITQNFLVEAQYSDKDFAFQNSGGRFTDFIQGTWINDTSRSLRWNAPVFCGVCTPEERNNKSWIAKANYFLSSNRLGSHNFVAGVEDFAEERIVNNYQSASQYEINTGGSHIVGGTIYPT
ncbi:MAG: carboxypeptidase regulatory-like domain-containing protein, partial [Thermoanaerobaculia bacterium]